MISGWLRSTIIGMWKFRCGKTGCPRIFRYIADQDNRGARRTAGFADSVARESTPRSTPRWLRPGHRGRGAKIACVAEGKNWEENKPKQRQTDPEPGTLPEALGDI